MTDLRQAAQQALEALESGMAFDKNSAVLQNLRTALEQPEQKQAPNRQVSQAAGTRPAPCARHCEAKAYEIEIRSLKAALRKALEQPEQKKINVRYTRVELNEFEQMEDGTWEADRNG